MRSNTFRSGLGGGGEGGGGGVAWGGGDDDTPNNITRRAEPFYSAFTVLS